MSSLDLAEWSSETWVRALGWTFLHSCWQGCVVAAAVGAALYCLHSDRARERYCCCALGFAGLLGWVLSTFIGHWSKAADAAGALPGLPLGTPALDRLVPWCAGFWIAGALVLHLRLASDYWRAHQLAARGNHPPPPEWQQRFVQLRQRLHAGTRVVLRESTRVLSPLVVGWLRPVVLVPTGLFAGLPPHQLEAVLAHELAHVRRHDFLINLFQSLGEALLFFHPGVWWLSRRMRVEREHCCDDVAVAACGDPLSYARALQSLDELREAEFRPALASTGGSLMTRIQRIVQPTRSRRQHAGRLLAALSLLSLITLGVAKANANALNQEESDQEDLLSRIDIVGTLHSVDPAQAKILGELQAHGLDNTGLMIVLQHYSNNPEVVAAITEAVHSIRQREVAREDEKLQKYVAALAAGKVEGIPEDDSLTLQEFLARALSLADFDLDRSIQTETPEHEIATSQNQDYSLIQRAALLQIAERKAQLAKTRREGAASLPPDRLPTAPLDLSQKLSDARLLELDQLLKALRHREQALENAKPLDRERQLQDQAKLLRALELRTRHQDSRQRFMEARRLRLLLPSLKEKAESLPRVKERDLEQ